MRVAAAALLAACVASGCTVRTDDIPCRSTADCPTGWSCTCNRLCREGANPAACGGDAVIPEASGVATEMAGRTDSLPRGFEARRSDGFTPCGGIGQSCCPATPPCYSGTCDPTTLTCVSSGPPPDMFSSGGDSGLSYLCCCDGSCNYVSLMACMYCTGMPGCTCS